MGQENRIDLLAGMSQQEKSCGKDESMAIPVKLEVFEGPLDLLLHLIDKNKVDIYDIPIVEITQQYMDYIKQMETEDMNVMARFISPISSL